jgi:predicted dehydrogenase/uncharacterized membrane protein YbhN (UPF0104 family)
MRARGALLGAGNIALRSHAPLWASDEALRDAVEIVAIADLAGSNREAMRSIFPAARFYEDAEELLARETLDFCDICTPPNTHRELIVRAATLHVHAICEKPLAPTVADAEGIAAAVRDAGIAFRPCHQYHYSPTWQAVRRMLPRLGHLHFVEYEVMRTAANPGNPHWSPEWRTQRAFSGGGILTDHGAHILYQLHSVLGPPRSVQAKTGSLLHRAYDVEDTALVTLDYGDRLAHLSLSWAARHREIRFHFVGEKGELTGDDRRIVVDADRREEIDLADGLSKDSWHTAWYAPLFREFEGDLHAARRDTGPLDEAVHVTRMIELAYASARLGRTLPADAPLDPALTAPADDVTALSVATEPDVVTRASRNPHGPALRIAAIGVVLAFGAVSLMRLEWRELWRALKTADPQWLALAAGLNLVVVAFSAMRWLALLRPLSPGTRLRDALAALAVGLAVSTVVPARGGELARIRWLHRRTGLSQAAILGSIGLDQVLNIAGLIACIALLPLLGGLPPWIRPAATLTLGLFALGVVALLVFHSFRRKHDGREQPNGGGVLDRVRLGLAAMGSPGAIARSLMVSFTAWGLEVLVTRMSMRAVGISLPFSASVVVLVAVNLMLAFPISPPGNVGTLEIGATLALLSYGIGKERALAFALCYHALQIIPIGAIGLALVGGAQRLLVRGRGGGIVSAEK